MGKASGEPLGNPGFGCSEMRAWARSYVPADSAHFFSPPFPPLGWRHGSLQNGVKTGSENFI